MSMEDLIAEEDVVVTDHPRRLRQAHQDRPVPLAAARRQGRARRAAARGRRRRALLRHDDARLDPVLHQHGPGLPREGVRAARGRARRARSARREPAGVPAGRADRPGARPARLRASRRTWCWRPGTGWSRRRGSTEYDSQPQPAASSPSTCARATSSSRARLVRRRRRPAAGEPQGPVGPVHAPTTTPLRPMGRATSGVIGMRFRAGDELLAMDVVRDGARPAHRHRRRLRQAHAPGRVDAQGPRRPGRHRDAASSRTGASLVGAVVVSEGDEVHGDHGRRRRDPDPDHRGLVAIHVAGHDGCALDEPRRG